MKWRDMLYFALCSIGSSLLRSLLTILGFAVGAGAVLAVLTLGDAGEARVETEIAKLGVNKVWIRQGNLADQFKEDDAELLTTQTGVPACASAVTFATIMSRERLTGAQILGLDERMHEVHSFKIVEGRALKRRECQQGSLVCLIDENLAEYFGNYGIGMPVYAANRRFIVVGIIEMMAGQNAAGTSGMMVIPLSTYLDTFEGSVSEIILHVPSGQEAETVAQQALATMSASGSFRAETLEEEINAAREVIRIFVTVLMAVAAICMLSGGMGVMNVLVLTVRERQQEIGMLKSIGATSRQVCLLFLSEAILYSILGGLLGTLLGDLMIRCASMLIGISGQARLLHIVGVLIASVMLGLVFGVIPAARAANLTPVKALQSQ